MIAEFDTTSLDDLNEKAVKDHALECVSVVKELPFPDRIQIELMESHAYHWPRLILSLPKRLPWELSVATYYCRARMTW